MSAKTLLVAGGLTPQVVTETVYALAVGQCQPWVPDEVQVLTTSEGAERVRLSLLDVGEGWFGRLRMEYGLPPIRFGEEQIAILRGRDGRDLRDIQTSEENLSAADALLNWVRLATSAIDSEVHVSLAGGRKTMGFFLGYALSLYGRPQDRMSHVLVDPSFESHPAFFYPTRESPVIYTAPPQSRPLDTAKATVTLAQIPFVRLRQWLAGASLSESTGFEEVVESVQSEMAAEVVIDLQGGVVWADGQRVGMAPAELAFYAMMARARIAGSLYECPGEGAEPELGEAFRQEYRRIATQSDRKRTEHALRGGMDRSFFLQRRSRVTQVLRRELGEKRARLYEVKTTGRRPNMKYWLEIEPAAIRFAEEG